MSANRRVIAFLVDLVVASAPFALAAAWVGMQGLGSLYHSSPVDPPSDAPLWITGGWLVAYLLFRDTRVLGRSLGRRVTDLQVAAGPAGDRAVLVRNAVTILLAIIPVTLVLEMILSLCGDRRRLADRIAGTRVSRATGP